MRFLSVIVCFLWIAIIKVSGQNNGYFVQLTDKEHSKYTIDQPGQFLSERALSRRQKQNIEITEQDLPVSEYYIDSLNNLGINVKHSTKWLNGVIAFSSDTELMDTLDQISFVSSVERTKVNVTTSSVNKFKESRFPLKSVVDQETYGAAWDQISSINGQYLHELGYKGEGMHVAVIDAGFYLADALPAFDHLWNNGQILGTKDFVDPSSNVFEQHYHGMKVLSIMGGEMDGEYLGTAPEASYWLLRTEDAESETPIEPDYYICALEFADSVGVDVVNTSLGYYTFDSPFDDYLYENLNGGTYRASKAAEIAVDKGMVLVVSAGNEGNDDWHYIGVPADASNIISVGAMAVDSTRASFSSYGPSYDGRVKPEITAMGYACAVQSNSGGVEFGSGTSYSSPVVAGLVTCLWQALSDYSAKDIVDLVVKTSHQYTDPDDSFGYGIPNFDLAINTNISNAQIESFNINLSPNPFSSYVKLELGTEFITASPVVISIYNLTGSKVLSKTFASKETITVDGLSVLPNGLYILMVEHKYGKQHFKIMKR